jgi:hypothetical protein
MTKCLALFAVALSSTVTYGKEIAIPELGVVLPGVPDKASAPQIVERPSGYAATLQIGTTGLSVYRDDKPVPPNASLADAAFRAGLQVMPEGKPEPGAKTAMTVVDGHEAWTWAAARRAGPSPFVIYDCVTFVIVDQHLYRFAANSLAQGTRPPEFVSAVETMSSVRFEPLRSPDPPPPITLADAKSGKTPRFVAGPVDFELYPAAAKRRGEHGAVDFEFTIDGRGHVRDIKQTYSAGSDLGKDIPHYLENGVFRVPVGWAQAGLENQHYKFEVQYSFIRHGAPCTEQKPARAVGAEAIAICADRP